MMSISRCVVAMLCLAGCAPALTERPRPPSSAPITLRPEPTFTDIDWQELALGRKSTAAEPVAAPAPAPAAPVEEAAPEVDPWPTSPDEQYMFERYRAGVRNHLNEVCEELIGKSPAAGSECRPVPLGIAFRGDRNVRTLTGLRVSDGRASFTTLVATGPAGVARVPVSMDVDDPDDPGCPSIVRFKRLERARMEKGYLALVAIGYNANHVEPEDEADDGYRQNELRVPLVAKWVDGEVIVRDYGVFTGPTLGSRVLPRAPKKASPWQPWKDRREMALADDGHLVVLP
jgi:hypothetical protein